ncbi:MAG TPA: FecR domain-containing protein [Puia sp.]|jgi:ferric-dicitrate binding protein FerR (iron transport regulator)|nr:FecR domain-containing protein [Puia sp.]
MAEQERLWELLTKQFDGHITEDELRELQALLNGQQDLIPYGELLSELKGLSLRPGPEDKVAKDNSLSGVMQSIRGNGKEVTVETPVGTMMENTGRRKSFYAWAGAAAAVLVIAAVYFFRKEGHAGGVLVYDRIVTKTGSRTLINLPDSSTVVLNSACQFAYNKDFGVKKREMQLTGEAFFDIHGNPDMPLVVHAGNVIIRVLGTSFNVRAYAEDSFVEATLLKGVIEVSLKTDPERKILLRPNEKIVIRKEAGKTLSPVDSSRSKSREEVIRVTQLAVDPRDSSYVETAWMKEKLIFRKESLVSLAARMERWYQVKIVLADTSLQSLLFTGSFEKETVEEAFRALQHSASFSYSIDGKTITVTKRK